MEVGFNTWFVLTVKAGRDAAVEERLNGQGLTVYSPRGRRVVIHKRYKTRLPKDYILFPGYVFVDQVSFDAARQDKDVVGFLGHDATPVPLPTGEVERVMRDEELGLYDSTKCPLVGAEVEIEVFGQKYSATVVGSSGVGITAEFDYGGKKIKVQRDIVELEG